MARKVEVLKHLILAVAACLSLAAMVAVLSGANTPQYLPSNGMTSTPGGNLVAPGSITTPTLNSLNALLYANNPRVLLAGWLFSYSEASTQRIDVNILGDSQSICYAAITSCLTGPIDDTKRWVDQLRVALGAAGSGFVPVMAGVSNSVVNNQFWAISGALTKSTILGPQQSNGAATGSSLIQLATGEILTFQPTSPAGLPIQYDHFSMMCAENSTSQPITVDFDGTGAGTGCAAQPGSPTPIVASFTAASGIANHVVHLTCVTGPCFVYAGDAETGTTGVRVNNFSTASAAAEYFGATPATQLAFQNILPHELTVIDLGTNDSNPAFGYSSTTFATSIQSILTNEAGLTGAPSVVVVTPPVSNNGASTGVWATYTAALATVVAANPVQPVNIQAQWGTVYNSVYFCADGIHPCDPGSLTEAQMIKNEILPQADAPPLANYAQAFVVNSTGSTPNPFYYARCAGSCDTGLQFQASTNHIFSVAQWGTGLGSGLNGAIGLYDQVTQVYPWVSSNNDDFCADVPFASGNVAGCSGAAFHVAQSTSVVTTKNSTLDNGSGAATFGGGVTSPQLLGAQAVTIGACTGTNGSNTFNCPAGNTAGTGAAGICYTAGGNECTLTSGLISITTGTGAAAGDIVEVKTNGSALAHALNCTLTGAGTGTLPLTSSTVATVDESSTTNGQFQIAALSAPTSSHQFLVLYNCTQ